MAKITTPLTEYSEIYDAIQTGEIKASMGDVVNEKFLMVNGYHLGPLPEGPLFLFKEYIWNKSTKNTFIESYIASQRWPLRAHADHLQVLNVEQTPFSVES